MYEYNLVNFRAVFLRLIVFLMTRGPFSLSNDTSATNRAWQLSLAQLESPYKCFHVVPLSQSVIFRLIPDFSGAVHKYVHVIC